MGLFQSFRKPKTQPPVSLLDVAATAGTTDPSAAPPSDAQADLWAMPSVEPIGQTETGSLFDSAQRRRSVDAVPTLPELPPVPPGLPNDAAAGDAAASPAERLEEMGISVADLPVYESLIEADNPQRRADDGQPRHGVQAILLGAPDAQPDQAQPTQPQSPPPPDRRFERARDFERRQHNLEVQKATAGNVEIDDVGLLELLDLEPGASLVEVSEARLRFLTEHDPEVEQDPEAALLKRKIRRQVNAAYASFRLVKGR